MKLFLDSANIDEIQKYKFLISGVTTNSSMKLQNSDIKSIINVLNETQELHIQINSQDFKTIIDFAKKYISYKNIVIKIPISINGLKACKYIKNEHNQKTNMTLCFTHGQIYSSVLAEANYVSVFVGRMENMDHKKMFLEMSEFKNHILAASIRNINALNSVLSCKINNLTLPYNVMNEMYKHFLTDEGYIKFSS